jgi:hypothetical protein
MARNMLLHATPADSLRLCYLSEIPAICFGAAEWQPDADKARKTNNLKEY